MESVTLELDDVTIEGEVWRDAGEGRASAESGGGRVTLSQEALNRMVPSEYSARLTLRDGTVRVSASTSVGAGEAEVPEEDVRLEGEAGAGTLIIEAPAPVGPITIPLPALVDGVVFESLDVEAGALTLEFRVRKVTLEL